MTNILCLICFFLLLLLSQVANHDFCDDLVDCPDEQALVSKLMKHRAKRYVFCGVMMCCAILCYKAIPQAIK